MMGFSSSAALSATLWPPSELLCRAWVTTLLRPVSGPSSGYTELLASLDWPRALSRSCRVNMESKDWRQWSEIQEDEGHGDGIVQGGGGLGHGAPGAAVLDQPHLPLWGRHLLPGHRRQHWQTCTGRALHKRPTAEVNCDSFEGFVKRQNPGTMALGGEDSSMGRESGKRPVTLTRADFFMARCVSAE